ncbi:MAG: SIS domain-containing protein [Candidatus Solibacter sp.]
MMIAESLLARNPIYEDFFQREAPRLARTARCMADRFRRGGRLLAFGAGAQATDAQHISVEFIHPVIVGKRALPAIDLSNFLGSHVETLFRAEDIVVAFGTPQAEPAICAALLCARRIGAMTCALPGNLGDYFVERFSPDAFLHQEMLEILYHTLWESVHVYLEHDDLTAHAGESSFLYPFLDSARQLADPAGDVAQSIRMKVEEDAQLRRETARQAAYIEQACEAIAAALQKGGQLLIFGNGGSATDANDFAFDCVQPPPGLRSIPALSLAAEPAVLTALANDVGNDAVFLRQLIAHARPHDVVIAISTSGGSRNLIAALEEARRRELTTVALLGYDGGEVCRRKLADYAIVVPSDYIPRIQEVQASIYHVMREALEEALPHA